MSDPIRQTLYSPSVRELIRRNLIFFAAALVAGLALRFLFVFRFPGVVNDSFVYGDIAKNWLQHGIYGLSGTDEISPTYIRLPGYPAFLALVFWIFGPDHYRAVLFIQVFVDIGTCFLCADIARRLLGTRAALAAFLLAVLCPFLADYSAAALTETLEIFFTALALDFALLGMQGQQIRHWVVSGSAGAAAILLRPDGTLLVIAIAIYLVLSGLFQKPAQLDWRERFRAILVISSIALAALLPWAIRNWKTFHHFQPLAPRYANEEGEFVPLGFNRWVKSWIADYVSVEEIYWPVPGSKMDVANLPKRAFDNQSEESQTADVIAAYNELLHISPELDPRFESLASELIRAHPIRYYLGLPVLRILDMWLRPRTEMLPCDSRWWEFNDEARWSVLAIAFGALNLAYVLCATVGGMKSRCVPMIGMLVLFVLLRSIFLGTLENPEPRYTLEMYPVIIALAASAVVRRNA